MTSEKLYRWQVSVGEIVSPVEQLHVYLFI